MKKVVGNDTTVFVYDCFGQLVAEYEALPPPPASPTTYLTTDNLGTPRVTTDNQGNVQARHDYLPFGEEIGAYGGRATHSQYHQDSVRQKFTGYQHDNENNLDYAQARYYAATAGRFTSVDPLMASASTTNPASFNRYSYALNNPYRYTDSSGMAVDEEVDEAFAQLRYLSDRAEAERQAQEDAARQAKKKEAQQHQQSQQQTNQQNNQQGNAPQTPPEPQEPVDKVVVNANDTILYSSAVNIMDKVDHYGDKRVPLNGEFEITYTFATTAPPEGSDPASYGQVQSITTQLGQKSGTLSFSSQVARVGDPVVIVNQQKERVEVTKTERFRILSKNARLDSGVWVINYEIVISSPTSGQVVRASTIENSPVTQKDKKRPKPIPVINVLKKQ